MASSLSCDDFLRTLRRKSLRHLATLDPSGEVSWGDAQHIFMRSSCLALYLILIIIKAQGVLQVSAGEQKHLSAAELRERCVLGLVGLSEGRD